MAEVFGLPWFILSVIGAFVGGILVLYVCLWLLPMIRCGRGRESVFDDGEWLEYYEKQFIDMKIRLDVLELRGGVSGVDGKVPTNPDVVGELVRLLTAVRTNGVEGLQDDKKQGRPSTTAQPVEEPKMQDSVPTTNPGVQQSPTDCVLQLITNGITTSRDLQITLKKSREHTARLLKKMYGEGYLHRDQSGRPYTYRLTQKGEDRLRGGFVVDV